MEDSSRHLQLRTKLGGIRQIAVVSQRHTAFHMIYDYRLAVAAFISACGGIADVPYRHIAAGQRRELCGGEHIPHETHILMGGYHSVLADGYAAAFLTAVL